MEGKQLFSPVWTGPKSNQGVHVTPSALWTGVFSGWTSEGSLTVSVVQNALEEDGVLSDSLGDQQDTFLDTVST